MLVVTTDSIPGYQVHAVIGEVVGVTARSFNPYLEGIKSLGGKLNPQLLRLLAQIRQEAVANMVAAAERRGANAILAMRFDNRDVTPPWREICAYGTAVLVVSAGAAPQIEGRPYAPDLPQVAEPDTPPYPTQLHPTYPA
jgi:uncharacterized protein YbjQ (UPF0145 family)